MRWAIEPGFGRWKKDWILIKWRVNVNSIKLFFQVARVNYISDKRETIISILGLTNDTFHSKLFAIVMYCKIAG